MSNNEVEDFSNCNKHQPVGKWISILYRQFQIYINHKLNELEISSSEYLFLLALYKQDGISQETLSASLYINKAATARALKSLEMKEYIERKKSISDKRINQVFVTSKGLAVKAALYSAIDQWNAHMTEGIDSETVELVTRTLKGMSESVTRKPLSKEI